MSEKHPREEPIFDGALQLPPEQRPAYLKAACAGDEVLLDRVRALLASDSQDEGPLAKPAVEPPGQPLAPNSPLPDIPEDRIIGNYKILQLIGEGGCGLVYMAEQERPMRRRVALKVIKLGMDTRQVVARFEAERQALALMDHPNIAKVLDAGATETGRPYFVMELVRGIRITDYCDQNNLDTPRRLKLFAQVCRAVQHAHQKGIIHRDIKPSNILVTLHDGEPVPKVIDFGIAKAIDRQLTDKTVFTRFEHFIGTPAYMSPEQAELSGLDIDTRSDIYSLGVLLYELLTSRTPFDPKQLMDAGLDAMRRIIREQEPPRPSTRLSTMMDADLTTVAKQRGSAPPKLVHLVKGDLDWVVMKSLEKDRTRRYETAGNFAADIENYLGNQPVVARPPSSLYRFQKFVRRNKIGVAATTAVAVSVLAGLVVSTWLFTQEKAARRRADAAAAHSQQVALFLEDMLKGVGPGVALGRDTTLLREILDKTVERVTKDLKDQPEVQAEICNTLGEVYRAIGQLNKAEELHRGARSLQGSGGNRADVATSLGDLALVLRDQGKYAEAEALQREALELRRKLYGNEHPEVALTQNSLALVLRSEGKLAEAEKMHRETLALQTKMFGHEHVAVATSLNNLALALRDEGRLAEAETDFRESADIQKKLLGDSQPALAITLDNLAFTLREEDKLEEAETVERRSVELQQKIFGPEHPSLATAMNDLAMIYDAQGKLTEAEQLHRQVLAMRLKMLGKEHPETAASLNNLAQVLGKEKKLAEAETDARESLAIRKEFFGPEHFVVASSLHTLGMVLRDEGKLTEAENCFQDAVNIDRKTLGDGHPALARTVSALAETLQRENKTAELEKLSRQDWVVAHALLTQTNSAMQSDAVSAAK